MVNVCFSFQHILNTIVDMVTESVHEILVCVCYVYWVKEVHEIVMLTLTVEVVIVHQQVVVFKLPYLPTLV